VAKLSVTRRPTHVPFGVILVLFIRNYSMKRVVVKEGRQTSAADTPSGEVTPTRGAGEGPFERPRTADEKSESSPSDLERGLRGGEDGADVANDEKGDKEVKTG
jgi:hypothetical protein